MEKRHGRRLVKVPLLVAVLVVASFVGDPAVPRTSDPAREKGQAPARPFPQHVPLPEGVIKPSSWTQEQIDRQVEAYYRFWKARYLRQVKGSDPAQKFVFYSIDYRAPAELTIKGKNDAFAVSTSEGHGYGMVIAALMAGYDPEAKDDFDALFRFCKAHPSSYDRRLMSWQQYVTHPGLHGKMLTAASGRPETARAWREWVEGIAAEGIGRLADTGSYYHSDATDGDMDIAYALLLADNQWGSGGAIDYRREALGVLHSLLDRNVDRASMTLKLGDWVAADDGNSEIYGKAVRTSDFMPSHLRAFAACDPANRDTWSSIRERIVRICLENFERTSPETGLLPDFLVRTDDGRYEPAPPFFLESRHDGDYSFNACRTPWRLSLDCILSGDASLKPMLDRTNEWIKQDSGMNVRRRPGAPGYRCVSGQGYYVGTRNGKRITDPALGDELCFSAPFAVSAMIDPSHQAWLDRLWEAIAVNPETDLRNPGYFNPANPQSDYYGHTIAMQVLLAVSGNFWLPR